MTKHNKETCQICTINKMIRECQADERQMKVINTLYDAWGNDSNDKAMYHSQVQELKIRVERLGTKLKEAVSLLEAGKAQFAPHTTNSDVDEFLKKGQDHE